MSNDEPSGPLLPEIQKIRKGQNSSGQRNHKHACNNCFHVQLICFSVNLIRFVLVLIDASPLRLVSVCDPGKRSESEAVI